LRSAGKLADVPSGKTFAAQRNSVEQLAEPGLQIQFN